jgi:YD repeat-containing protein
MVDGQTRKDGALFAEYAHDANGNRLSYQGTFGSLTGTYDAQGRLTAYGDTTFEYTANGELVTRTQGDQTPSPAPSPSTTTPQGDRAHRGIAPSPFDANSNLTEVLPPGRPAHTFGYNAVDLVTRYSAPDLGVGPVDATNEYDLDRSHISYEEAALNLEKFIAWDLARKYPEGISCNCSSGD